MGAKKTIVTRGRPITVRENGSKSVSEIRCTYSFPEPIFTLACYQLTAVWLGEG